MGIGGINKNNFWQNKLTQNTDTTKNLAWQTKQLYIGASQKTENSIKDSVELSTNGKQQAREATNEISVMESNLQELRRQLENSREQGKAMGDEMKVRMKCLIIAMRIMSGDEVPSEDYRYLAKNDLDLYARALSMRMEKENPRKHKRLSEDEESGESEGAGDSASVESIETASGEIQTEVSGDSPESSETP